MRCFVYAIGLVTVMTGLSQAQLLGGGDAPPDGKAPPQRPAPNAPRAADVSKPPAQNAGAPQANAILALLDADGDQEISRKELSQLLKNWKTLDTDRNGKLSLLEMSAESGAAVATAPNGQGADDPDIARLMAFDTSPQDGRLTRGEVPPNLLPMLQGLDPDNNGITRQELIAAKAMMGNQRGAGPWWNRTNRPAQAGDNNAQQATAQFLRYDKNADGQITERELQRGDRDVMLADTNNDGKVDAAEFQAANEKQGRTNLPPGVDPNDPRARKNAPRDRRKPEN